MNPDVDDPAHLPANPRPDRALTAPSSTEVEPPGRAAPDHAAAVVRSRPGTVLVGAGGPWVRLCETETETEAGAEPSGSPDGLPGGSLAGLRVGVKDLVAVAGLPVGAGCRARAGAPPEPRDAAVVRQLRRSGASVVGAVALHELAFGVTGINDGVGFPTHPHDDRCIPGGSSSGSAVAVADGSCDLAVGTDTGGSVRIPAALCGVTGFKPSRGRYPLDGVLALAPSLDHLGLLARTVGPIVAAHQALTGEAVPSRAPSRMGIDRAALAAADDPVAEAVASAIEAIRATGCTVVDVAWPDAAEVVEVSTAILFSEAAAVHRELLASSEALIGADVAGRLAVGARVTSADYRRARTAGRDIEAAARSILAGVDAVLGPTTARVAATIESARTDEALPWALVRGTRLANLAGLAALTLPLRSPGLPVGLQLAAATDALALGVGSALEPLVA